MADLSTSYVLTTPGPDITFNSGDLGDGTDKYWIQEIPGLDGPDVRAPIDPVPFGDGGIIHTFWQGPRQITIDGVLIIETVALNSAACQQALNVMEDNLRQAVVSIIAADGTLAWTPAGLSARSLTVRHNGQPRLDVRPIENYHLRQFMFSLVSESSSWA